MFLENLVVDATDPHRLGRFWEAALGGQTFTDEAEGYETRLTVEDGPVLDLCLPRVESPTTSSSPRVHLDLHGGTERDEVVARLLELGVSHLDIGQGDVPWVVLADPEGHAFCVMEERAAYRDTGPVAAVVVRGEDARRDAAFWAEASGWVEYDGVAPVSLRHPTGRGPVLEFFGDAGPKSGKNRMHLDLRLEAGDDAAAIMARFEELGASRLEHDWGALPWTPFTDPSGNEFCLLPVSSQ